MTTDTRAKEVRKSVEKMITLGESEDFFQFFMGRSDFFYQVQNHFSICLQDKVICKNFENQ